MTKNPRFRTKDSITSTSNAESRTVLVTGGCGFIGTNLVKYLSERRYKVRILDNLSTSARIWNAGSKPPPVSSQPIPQSTLSSEPVLSTVDLVLGDIRYPEVVKKAVDRIDAVVHLAAHSSVMASVENPKGSWDINVNGTLNLLEACRHHGIDKFIFASSNAVLGEQPPPVDESKICHPLSPYGASKLAGEALCSAYYHSFGLNTISLRFANCYGRYSEHKTSVITQFIDWARQGKPLIIYGDGNQTRDFVHADDICQAIYLCLVATERIAGETFQTASGVETSINELIEMLKETTNFRLSIIREPKRKGEIERSYSDITKARRMLGFKPTVKLSDGLRDLWQWYAKTIK